MCAQRCHRAHAATAERQLRYTATTSSSSIRCRRRCRCMCSSSLVSHRITTSFSSSWISHSTTSLSSSTSSRRANTSSSATFSSSSMKSMRATASSSSLPTPSPTLMRRRSNTTCSPSWSTYRSSSSSSSPIFSSSSLSSMRATTSSPSLSTSSRSMRSMASMATPPRQPVELRTCYRCKQAMPMADLAIHRCTLKCEDCGKNVRFDIRWKHKCYRKRHGLTLHACADCGSEFISASALATHMRSHQNANPYTAPYEISSADLLKDSDVFTSHEPVLAQRLIHATKVGNTESILKDRFLYGGSGSTYDAVLFTEPDAPPSLYTELRPASDLEILPYSFYPKDVPLLGDVTIFSIDTGVLLEPQYRMFYHKTQPSQRGARFTHNALTQIVFVHEEDTESMAFAGRHFMPLDKRENSVFRFTGEDGWTFAARVSHMDSSGEVSPRPHKVVVVFLRGLRLTESAKLEHVRGRRAGRERKAYPCPTPECTFRASNIPNLKLHMLRYHTGEPQLPCSFNGCDYKGRLKRDVDAHEKRCHTDPNSDRATPRPSINLNTADAAELKRRLCTVKGVGLLTADALIDERDSCGPYHDWDDVSLRITASRRVKRSTWRRAIESLRGSSDMFHFND